MTTALLLPLVFTTRIYSSFLHSTVSYVTHCLRMRSPFGPENLWTKFTRSRYCQSACSCIDVGQARLHWLKQPREWTCECPALHPSTHQSWAPLKWGRVACALSFLLPPMLAELLHLEKNDVSYSAARLRVRDICQQCRELGRAHALCLLPPIKINGYDFGKWPFSLDRLSWCVTGTGCVWTHVCEYDLHRRCVRL